MIEKWVNFKRDYLEISFLREKWVCAILPYHRQYVCITDQRCTLVTYRITDLSHCYQQPTHVPHRSSNK